MRLTRLVVLFAVLFQACGALPPASFCQQMATGSAHLVTVLQNCSQPSDSSITAFNRSTCDTKSAADCSDAERAALELVASCEANITPCFTSGDRSKTVAKIEACSADAGVTFSSKCLAALN